MKGAGKTNAMRQLERGKIPYTAHQLEVSADQPPGAVEAAALLGVAAAQVFKTLVTQAGDDLFVFVIRGDGELDLKKAAKAAGVKSVQMLPSGMLREKTGYEKGGCSPVGMKKSYPTFLDESADDWETIFVSAGRIGSQLELAPDALCEFIGAKTADVVTD